MLLYLVPSGPVTVSFTSYVPAAEYVTAVVDVVATGLSAPSISQRYEQPGTVLSLIRLRRSLPLICPADILNSADGVSPAPTSNTRVSEAVTPCISATVRIAVFSPEVRKVTTGLATLYVLPSMVHVLLTAVMALTSVKVTGIPTAAFSTAFILARSFGGDVRKPVSLVQSEATVPLEVMNEA